ncbi:unnamed protein product [Peniophora sp. CBMAI 1063]|nr:unnamed protein product [Peniophora sp. CBMAI 1063]
MTTKPAIQEQFRAFVLERAHPFSQDQYDACADSCASLRHDLYGPYLEYKKDSFNLGRQYIFCKEIHYNASGRPRKTWKYISKPLTSHARRTIRDRAREVGITLASPPAGIKFSITIPLLPVPPPMEAGAPEPAVLDLTSPSPPPPSSTPPRSPSVEITGYVPAPPMNTTLTVHYFFADKTKPTTFDITGGASPDSFKMRKHVDALLDVEIKQSDELDILTFGSVGFEMWATFRVSTLAILRRILVLVVSRHSVRKCHKSITALYEHAFPEAATLPGRIIEIEDEDGAS